RSSLRWKSGRWCRYRDDDLVWGRRRSHPIVDKFPDRDYDEDDRDRCDRVTKRFPRHYSEVRLRLFRKRIDPLGQREVELGQTTLAVGRKQEAHFIIANVDVGMMLFFLGHFRDCVHELDGI